MTPSTTLLPAPPPRPADRGAPARSGRTLSLDLSDEPDALMRVLSLLHRRRCEILSIDYDAGHRRRPRLTVRVRHHGGRPESLEAGLRGTIGVLGVAAAA